MTAIKQEDLIQSVADAFQYISYQRLIFIKALGEACEREELGGQGCHRPDPDHPACPPKATTSDLPGYGIGMVFLKVGMDAVAGCHDEPAGDDGQRRCQAPTTTWTIRCAPSVLADPAGNLQEQFKDNTPPSFTSNVPGHHTLKSSARPRAVRKPRPSSPYQSVRRPVDWV